MTASITIRRRVQWMDTDAQGIWHHSVVIRWLEEAEAELHRELGIIGETFGRTPRVRTEFDFKGAVRFDDPVDITLTVDRLGETSIGYAIEVASDSEPIVLGRLIAVFIDPDTGQKRSWPDHIRRALAPT
jgi:acyl-CoA thioester hydrolase